MPELAGYKEKGKEIFKKGWHPEKEGTTFKGQVVWNLTVVEYHRPNADELVE